LHWVSTVQTSKPVPPPLMTSAPQALSKLKSALKTSTRRSPFAT
jgi:hypothetical protein